MMSNADSQIRALIRLALKDEHFADVERNFVYRVGQVNKLSKDRVDELVKEEFSDSPTPHQIHFEALTFDQRFEYLYDLVQLMKADYKIFLSEIKFCQEIAQKLGFAKNAVQVLSKKVFADPTITADREKLKQEVRRYVLA
ncbi:MAG: TerB family tellurite resistance protein [Bacteroidota bacterium]